MNSFFFTREEDDTKVVYHLKNAWIPFIFAWVGVIGVALWLIGPESISRCGKIVFLVAAVFLLFRWVCFFKANCEMLSAKYSDRMTVEGSKFSSSNPPVITIKKEGASPVKK